MTRGSASTNSFKYHAFISYSHDDEKWANWLHNRLEKYSPPPGLKLSSREWESCGSSIDQPLYPMFLDDAELAATSDLSESLTTALEQSRYLIVICSPSAAKSEWVNKEVDFFAGLGRQHRMFAVLVDGVPKHPASDDLQPGDEPAFPTGLVVHHENGTGSERELLHQRLPPGRLSSRHRSERRDSLLRIAARILNVGYDDLARRDEKRRYKTQRGWAAIALAAVILVAASAVYHYSTVAAGERRIAEEQRQRTHDATVDLAERSAARGNWRAALAAFDTAIADDLGDATRLRVERVRAWFPLGDRIRLDRELKELEAIADQLGEDFATVQLLRGDYLMAEPGSQQPAIDLVTASLSGKLSPADEAYARGLIAENVEASEKFLREAIGHEDFHHRANSMLAVLLVQRGRYDAAAGQIEFLRRAFPDDPAVVFLKAWFRTMTDQNSEVAPAQTLEAEFSQLAAAQNIQAEPLIRYLQTQKSIMASLRKVDTFGGGLPIAGQLRLLGDVNRLVGEFGVNPAFGRFGLSLSNLPWFVNGMDQFIHGIQAALGPDGFGLFGDLESSIELVQSAIEANPDGLFVYALAQLKAKHSKRHLGLFQQDTQSLARELRVCGDIFHQAANSDSFYPIDHSARLMGIAVDSFIYNAMEEPRIPELIERIREQTAILLKDERLTDNELRQTAQLLKVLTMFDPDVTRSILEEWHSRGALDATSQLAQFELSTGRPGRALDYANEVLVTMPDHQPMLEVKAKAEAALRKSFKNSPPETRQP